MIAWLLNDCIERNLILTIFLIYVGPNVTSQFIFYIDFLYLCLETSFSKMKTVYYKNYDRN